MYNIEYIVQGSGERNEHVAPWCLGRVANKLSSPGGSYPCLLLGDLLIPL